MRMWAFRASWPNTQLICAVSVIFLKHNQPMVNYASRELAIGKTKCPHLYTLYRAESR